MKAMKSTVGSRDRLTVTLFLAGVFHLIVILGISFAPPAADSGSVPTLEVLLVNNPLPDATTNDSANYLAERTQQGSGNSPDGQTRQPTAGDAPETIAGAPTGGTAPPAPEGRTGADGELLTSQAGTRRLAATAVADTPPAALPRETLAGSQSALGPGVHGLTVPSGARRSGVTGWRLGTTPRLRPVWTVSGPGSG